MRYGIPRAVLNEYIAAALPELGPQVATGKIVVLHLGNGAEHGARLTPGESIASTMGFTAVEGT